MKYFEFCFYYKISISQTLKKQFKKDNAVSIKRGDKERNFEMQLKI